MNIRRIVGTGAAVLAMAALLIGCGDSDDDNGDAADPGNSDAVASSLEFTAEDIAFAEETASADAGEIEVSLVNDGAIEHSWVIEDREDDLRLHVEKNGDTDNGTISLDAGEYVYYCDIPGHREAGMEGTLSVD